MKKNYKKNIFITFILIAFIFINSCKPVMGSAWYPRASVDEASKLYITEIIIHGNPVTPFLAEQPIDDADKLKKFVEAGQYFVNVAPSVDEITSENIKVKAVSSLSKMEEVAITVEINGEGVPLVTGKAVPITIKIADTQAKYGEVTKIIKITQSEPFELKLESLTIAEKNAMGGSVSLPYAKAMISAADIKAEFSYGTEKTVIPVTLERNSIELKQEESIDVKIFVKGKKGQYKDFEKTVSVTRAQKAEGEDTALEPIEIYVQGIKNEIGKEVSVPINTTQITEEDIIVVFKTFDYLPVKLTPNPIKFDSSGIANAEISVPAVKGKYLGWNTPITIKKNAAAVYNPVDKDGNKKYTTTVNTITEEIDPFVYYTENYEFPASKFDEWVLNMPEMSGIVPSYKFIDGSWSGTPEVWSNQPGQIGSGIKAISNVQVYRYKTRSERWTGGEVPAPNHYDDRFYFYRFTAEASGGVRPDSSLFCVDRYSKFLFYYSDPSYIQSILGNKVPLNWVDYAVSTRGDHVQFTEPFYMTDPVGYVKEDGTIVIYSWVKDKINNSNYTASQNSAFTKPAEKKANGAGFSPYRNKIITKKTEVITAENPDYTLAEPLILAQPKALRIKLNAPEEAIMTVKTTPVPEGEKLSYQWYTNTIQSNEGGTPISDAVSASYQPNKGQETNCYVYCAVTNTNTKNNKFETVNSSAVKLLITNGPLIVDAALPKITKQPEGKTILINASGAVTLTVEAGSLDNGTLSYQWYKKNEAGDSELPDAKEKSYSVNIDTFVEKEESYYCIVTNTNEKVDGNKTASIATVPAKIVVEESYKLTFTKTGGGKITALYDGKLLESGNNVKKGKKVTFFAEAKDGYEVLNWSEGLKVSENKLVASLTVEKEEIVNVVFREIPNERTLTIIAKEIKNVDMTRDKNSPYTYFVYNLKAGHGTNVTSADYITLWHTNKGEKLTEHWPGELYKARKLYADENMFSGKFVKKHFDSLPDTYQVQLDLRLIKYHNVSNVGTDVYKEKILVDYGNSLITISYQKESDTWVWNKISDKNLGNKVIVEFPDSISLKRGDEKDFTFKYTSSDSKNKAVGTVEVTYTLKWE